MLVAVNGHPLPLLPALDRGHVAAEVGGDFLPRIQPVLRGSLGWRCAREWFAHRVLLFGSPVLQEGDIPATGPGQARRGGLGPQNGGRYARDQRTGAL